METKRTLKLIGRILFVGLVFFTILFGTYQLFFDSAEAGLFSCEITHNCQFVTEDCSGNIKCTCRGSIFTVCMIGGPVFDE